MNLSEEKLDRLQEFARLLRELNRRINLISREDEANVYEHHVRHCLTLASRRFPAGCTIIDWGTGGGLPAVPLAIAFPEIRVIGLDAIEKKVQAVRTIARRLQLKNLEAWHGRAEAYPGNVDFSVSRATAPLADLWSWHRRVARAGGNEAGCWRRGLVCLKGGDLVNEIAAARALYPGLRIMEHPIQSLPPTPYFEEKVILECWSADEPEEVEHR